MNINKFTQKSLQAVQNLKVLQWTMATRRLHRSICSMRC